MKRTVDVLTGAQWGDEGKGKIINDMASKYDVMVRYNGGANSGHTVYTDSGRKVIFNVLPSGLLNKELMGVISGGVVINPYAFMKEVSRVAMACEDKEINDDNENTDVVYDALNKLRQRLFISMDTHLTLPIHILIDIFSERGRQEAGQDIIGSTNRGNTPTYVDKVARRGIRVSDIFCKDFKSKYVKLTKFHIQELKSRGITDDEIWNAGTLYGIGLAEYQQEWLDSCVRLRELNCVNTVTLLHNKIAAGAKILLEGAQGLMLDIDYGTYPFVTSSSVTASAAFAQTGIPVQCVNKVFAVMKPYNTRVGSGFFPSKLADESPIAEELVRIGGEFGSVTGRKRKIGWLDMVQIKHACMINGVTDVIIAKCDVISGIKIVEVIDKYIYGDNKTTEYNGENGFTGITVELFNMFGELTEDNVKSTDSEIGRFIKYINNYLSDVITKPKVVAISISPKEPFITL